jgi:hypothetical protein
MEAWAGEMLGSDVGVPEMTIHNEHYRHLAQIAARLTIPGCFALESDNVSYVL